MILEKLLQKKKGLSLGLRTAILAAILTGYVNTSTFDAAAASSNFQSASVEIFPSEKADFQLPEGVVPVTWKPSPENLILRSDEARELYERIKAKDYPSVEELEESNVIKQIDALSEYYVTKYGITGDIDTPERNELREEIKKRFLTAGSARLTKDKDGIETYVYDGELQSDYWAEIVLGLPASGKSTLVTDPDSAKMGAFIFDSDVIKTMIPEYQESYGLAADAVHTESKQIRNLALTEFTEGSMKGDNFIMPTIGDDLNKLMETYITPLENAGYTIHIKYCDSSLNESLARNLARELESGRIIRSSVVFSFGNKPKEVYEKLCTMTGKNGKPYVAEEDTVSRGGRRARGSRSKVISILQKGSRVILNPSKGNNPSMKKFSKFCLCFEKVLFQSLKPELSCESQLRYFLF